MLFNTVALSSLLVASALAVAEPAPYKLERLGSMSYNKAFGLAKRQAGYEPGQTYCGPGTDCASSCGAGYIQCPSSDADLHCFNPEVKQTCCPDGSGNSCDAGYFCTSDSTGGTWCCPDGMSLAECAAAYSITGSLVSQTAAATSSASSAPVSASASASTTSGSAPTSSSVAKSMVTSASSSLNGTWSTVYSTKTYTITSCAPTVTNCPAGKVTTEVISVYTTFCPYTTYSSSAAAVVTTPAAVKPTSTVLGSVSASKNGTATTSSTPLQVTGGAAHVAYAGLPALALAAGALFAL